MNQASTRLEKAAGTAYDLIHNYAEKDPRSDDPQNPWLNLEEMHGNLDSARRELMQAWDDLKTEHELRMKQQKESKQSSSDASMDPEEFRALYMDMITDAFADALESMREQDEDNIDVDVLVDCLQSGMDLLDADQRDGFFRSLDDLDDDEEDENSFPIHELRRRELGYPDVSVSS